jgi:hypothetical protein
MIFFVAFLLFSDLLLYDPPSRSIKSHVFGLHIINPLPVYLRIQISRLKHSKKVFYRHPQSFPLRFILHFIPYTDISVYPEPLIGLRPAADDLDSRTPPEALSAVHRTFLPPDYHSSDVAVHRTFLSPDYHSSDVLLHFPISAT